MKNIKIIIPLTLLLVLPISCFAVEQTSFFHFGAEVLTYVNYVVVITSLISIRQFFWPGNNRTVFHIFNLIFIVLFYLISLSFLIRNKRFYEGYENLSPLSCIFKVFFSFDFYSILQLIVLFAFFINIIYIIRNRKGFYYNN